METNADNYPDILNSRNERIILELPNYSYSHSSQTQGENQSFFLGRKSLLHKLTNLLSTAASKTGVYLVTGNRGVGKSKLVEEVIKKTSIQEYGIAKSISFLVIALFLTLGLQYATNQGWLSVSLWWAIVPAIILIPVIGHNSYLRKTTRQYEKPVNWIQRQWTVIMQHTGLATLKDFLMLPNKANSFLRTLNVLKLALLLLLFQIFAKIPCLTHFQLFIIYLSAVAGYHYVRYANKILIQEYQKSYVRKTDYWKCKNEKVSLADAFKPCLQWITPLFVVFISIVSAVSLMIDYCWCIYHWGWGLLGIVLIPFIVFVKHWYAIRLTLRKDEEFRIKKVFKFTWEYSYPQLTSLSKRISHYIQNSSRVYLKINFGHDVLEERDVLRLITRTLTTEYKRFRHSWIIHTLYWRVLALAVLLSATYLFYQKVYKIDVLPLVEQSALYKCSSQLFYASDSIETKDTILREYIDLKNSLTRPKTDSEKQKIIAKMNGLRNTLQTKNNNILQKRIIKYIIPIDNIINRTWGYIFNTPNYFWAKDGKEINYKYKPVNYAWLFIFFSFYLLGCLFLRLPFPFYKTHYSIRKQLEQLNENIIYSIEREWNIKGSKEKWGIKSVIGIGKKKTRLVADAHEIEKELQDILEDIQKIPAFMARPEFVIVFDELDKVSPETPNQESETKHKEALFAANSTRERQAVILKLLSNMKYFLSTAKAKFIFIAGREMYDMYLADIADRNNYFGSIFNEVVFVPSFLTDAGNNEKQYDITSLAEEYVCRHLIPRDYPAEKYTLKVYNKYLKDVIYEDVKEKDAEERQVEMKKQKIIATLQHFIIYLTHTSKGAPKKMVQVFESFIKSSDNEELKDQELLVRQFKRTKLYLDFDYYEQFTIGMTSYLLTPIINRLSEANIQKHSDKLLVSTLHFVDYMMKFHSQNFSWRSLDISPEVIEINRSPELKTIVNDIVTLFEQIHFHKPIISLYEFKFDALLAQEIFFLSKTSERFSAQFNFSLDESLYLKEYYKGLLRGRQAEYEKYKKYGCDYVSSIASLQMVIGDLHFLDDELEEAALYYKDGLYLLKKQLYKDKDKENLELFYLFIRNQLKLAYLYEKRKQAEFACLLYGELSTLVVEYRDFDLEKIGISIRKDGDDFVMVKHWKDVKPYDKYIETPELGWDISIYDDLDKAKIRPMQFKQLSPATQRVLFKNMTFEGLQLLYLPLLAKLQILEKRSPIGILKKDIDLIEQEFDFLTRTIRHSETKILAADFYSKIGDILFYKNKVFNSFEEKPPKDDDIRRIKISHYACLYYKKAFIALTVRMSNESEKKDFEKETVLDILFRHKKADYIASKVHTRYRAMMARVLSNLGDVYLQANENHCASCDFLKKDCNGNPCNIPFTIAGKATQCTNAFWNNWWCYIEEEKYSLSKFLTDIHEEKNNMQLSNVELALFFYSLSMKYYRKANNNKQYAYQIEKILNVLKYCLRHDIHRNRVKQFLIGKNTDNCTYLETLTHYAIRALYLAYDSLNVFEINKRKEDFDKFSKPYGKQKVPLHYIQVDSNVSRIRNIVKELELELAEDKVEKLKQLYAQYITSPYQINYSIWARVQRLKMKERLNREAYTIMKNESFKYLYQYTCSDRIDCVLPWSCEYCEYSEYNNNLYCQILTILTNEQARWDASKTKEIFGNKINNLNKSENNFLKVLEMLITDSIFCLDEVLCLIQTAGDSYLFNHSLFAVTYDRLAVWAARYEALKNIKDYYDNNDRKGLPPKFHEVIKTVIFPKSKNTKLERIFTGMQIDNYMKRFFGKDFRETLSSHYYRERALMHYYQTFDTHNGGRAYLNLLEQMYFIKGDYDDVPCHFNVAIERFLTNNSDDFQDSIKRLKRQGTESTLYDVDNYFEKDDEE